MEELFTAKNYIRPHTLEEAYDLCLKKSNVVVGGMLWLKMNNRSYNTVIDLCELGLDKIEVKDGFIHIGAYVKLRDIEKNEKLNELTCGALADSVKNIVGVQFRNCATVGGSIYGRFGFSDILTVFSVLDAKVNLYKKGIMSLDKFIKVPRNDRDILTEIIIPDKKIPAAYEARRNTATDFAVLNCAVSTDCNTVKCAVGARPLETMVLTDEEDILKDGITIDSAQKFGEYIAEKVPFGSNMRAGEEYRKKICPVLVRRALMKMKEGQK